MSEKGAKYLCDEVWNKIDYCRAEFFMSNCELVGILEMVKNDLLIEISLQAQMEEDDDQFGEVKCD